MLERDIEMFIEHCGLKGLSTKTINSYEQTLRLFMQYMDEQGILLTEKITHLAIQGYIKSINDAKSGDVSTKRRFQANERFFETSQQTEFGCNPESVWSGRCGSIACGNAEGHRNNCKQLGLCRS